MTTIGEQIAATPAIIIGVDLDSDTVDFKAPAYIGEGALTASAQALAVAGVEPLVRGTQFLVEAHLGGLTSSEFFGGDDPAVSAMPQLAEDDTPTPLTTPIPGKN